MSDSLPVPCATAVITTSVMFEFSTVIVFATVACTSPESRAVKTPVWVVAVMFMISAVSKVSEVSLHTKRCPAGIEYGIEDAELVIVTVTDALEPGFLIIPRSPPIRSKYKPGAELRLRRDKTSTPSMSAL